MSVESKHSTLVTAISVALLVVACVSFSGCSKSVEKQLVGKWSRLDETWPAQKSPRGIDFEYTVTIEFLADGTYTLTNELGSILGHPEGKYKLMKSGDNEGMVLDKLGIDGLNTKISGQIAPGLPRLETSEAKYTITIEGDKLTFTGDNGESVFLRVEQ